MTKQAMAELVAHLEGHGYVVREPDPDDRRAKLVIPTERGLEVFAVVQELIPEIEHDIDGCSVQNAPTRCAPTWTGCAARPPSLCPCPPVPRRPSSTRCRTAW